MRLFQTRYSTGCHLFGETRGGGREGGRDYREEGYVCIVCASGSVVRR